MLKNGKKRNKSHAKVNQMDLSEKNLFKNYKKEEYLNLKSLLLELMISSKLGIWDTRKKINELYKEKGQKLYREILKILNEDIYFCKNLVNSDYLLYLGKKMFKKLEGELLEEGVELILKLRIYRENEKFTTKLKELIEENFEKINKKEEIAKAYGGDIAATIFVKLAAQEKEGKNYILSDLNTFINYLSYCVNLKDDKLRIKVFKGWLKLYVFFKNGKNKFKEMDFVKDYYERANKIEREFIDLIDFYYYTIKEKHYAKAVEKAIEYLENSKNRNIEEYHLKRIATSIIYSLAEDPKNQYIPKIFALFEELNYNKEKFALIAEITQRTFLLLKGEGIKKEDIRDSLKKKLVLWEEGFGDYIIKNMLILLASNGEEKIVKEIFEEWEKENKNKSFVKELDLNI